MAQIKGYEKVPSYSEEALQKAVANQPVSVSIDANNGHFMFYAGGIYISLRNCGLIWFHRY